MTEVSEHDIAAASARLGRKQVSLLGAMLGQYRDWRESYYPGDGWSYSTKGETVRLLRTLVTRGLVEVIQVPALDGMGWPVKDRTADRYVLTDLGRAVGARHFPVDQRRRRAAAS